MFERYTEQARQALTFARGEARLHGHDQIATGHVLVGLLRAEDGLAASVLEGLDVTLPRVRAQILRTVGPARTMTAGATCFSRRAKKVLGVALREALGLGLPDVGTEHILLAIAGDSECLGGRILTGLGADSEMIRDEVMRLLSDEDARGHVRRDEASVGAARLPDVGHMSAEAVDELIARLTVEERRVSFRRRILHAKIDILRVERGGHGGCGDGLAG